MKKIYKKFFPNKLSGQVPISWNKIKYLLINEWYWGYSDEDIKKLFTAFVKDLKL